MPKNSNSKPVKRDEPMTSAMKFFLAGCVAELYLLIIRRFYVNGSAVQQIAWFDKYLFLLMGIGASASPLIGMFADRYLHAERVLCLCFVLSGLFLCAAFFATSAAVLFWFLLGAVCFYMPTWALTFTILVLHAPPKHFPWMRSLGTAGWVAAGGFSAVAAGCGFKTFDSSNWIFAAGAVTSPVRTLVMASSIRGLAALIGMTSPMPSMVALLLE